MKYLICSDIHGSIDSANFIANEFKKCSCDYIICLGDVLYHGPRNDLPEAYKPKEVITALNELKDKIICVKGNCEAEVDQMVLDFKINDYLDITINGIKSHLEHGHHLDQYNGDASIVLYGHTHIPSIEIMDNQVFVNPGSITIPKNGSARSYAIWDERRITIYSMDKKIVKEYEL
ncbi:MAG: phosphodiesterase [Erysipelotrichaceae bacterium]|nr:phosphodiesterase [Erysipelotrichaceae bacterium]